MWRRRILPATCASMLLVATHIQAQDLPEASEQTPASAQAAPESTDADLAPDSEFRDAFVTLAVLPRYPKSALRKGRDARVTAGFEIDRVGRVGSIKVLEESPAGDGFAREVEEAMEFWAFSPARLPLCGTTGQKAEQTFVFDHDSEQPVSILPLVVEGVVQEEQPLVEKTLREYWRDQNTQGSDEWGSRNFTVLRRVEPDYPLKALEREKEGVVSMVFLIGRDGSVSNVEVVDSVQATFFQRPALSAIRQWRFEPRRRGGMPVDSVACHEFVFQIDEYKQREKMSKERQKKPVSTY